MNASPSKGLLSVEVKAPPIVAGTMATVSLIIRNPFPDVVEIESIQAPSSAPLLPYYTAPPDESGRLQDDKKENSFVGKLYSKFGQFRIEEIQIGLLSARFPRQRDESIYFNLKPKSKLDIRTPFSSSQSVYINAGSESEVTYQPAETIDTEAAKTGQRRLFQPHQEDIASFELQTAKWLLVKPKTMELHALIRYKIGIESRSQVIPVSISVQPPVKSIVIGSITGGLLGYTAKQLNTHPSLQDIVLSNMIVIILGITVMATIIAIVLSRQDTVKGFVTLEDFYGAFVVGTVLGYTGTEYFEGLLSTQQDNSAK